jgi:CDP-diacylglycerol--inositol 3-phosphatidyltransferase
MPLHPRRCSFLYSISCLLDALDGIAARRFQQSTKFGAVLDMVTDRCTTTCLLVFLATAKPAYSMIFQGLISLDLASHYMHMYATLTMGGSGESHKNVSAERSWIMNKYYTNKVCLCGLYHRQHMADIDGRPSCSRSAHSTSSSSSPSTSSASHRL